MKKIYLVLIFLGFLNSLNAQFTISGQYIPRTEFSHGFKSPMLQSRQMFALTTAHRARLNALYSTEKYSFFIQFQDVRPWGASKQLVIGDGNYTTLHQAWGEVKFNKNLSLKLGRQELIYDDHRILGNVDWALQARSHDLALFKYEKENFKLHFGTAVNQVQTFNYSVAGNYKSMQFLWINRSINDKLALSFLALNHGLNDTTLNGNNASPMTTYSQIVGLRPVYKSDKFSFALNVYYMMGKDVNTYLDSENHHVKYSAYNIRMDLTYQLNENIKLDAGYEMLSGNSQTDTSFDASKTNNAFNPLFGTNHKFNGFMDYFYVGNHINSVGLNDAFIGISWKKDQVTLGCRYHYFLAAADVLDLDEFSSSGQYKAMNSGLGFELDTWAAYKFSDDLMFKAGISGMFDSKTMRSLKGGNPGASNYWAYMMFIFKPTIFKK